MSVLFAAGQIGTARAQQRLESGCLEPAQDQKRHSNERVERVERVKTFFVSVKADGRTDAAEGKVGEHCDRDARSPFPIIGVYLAIIISAVLFVIALVELWRWAK